MTILSLKPVDILNRFALIVFICFIEWQTAFSEETDAFVFSVVPQMSTQKTQKIWTPFLSKLEEKTGKKFRLVLHLSVTQFEAALINGEADFAYMNPYHLIMTRRSHPYVPLIRDAATDLTGILVVNKNSSINTLKELQGKTVAFPSPNAFAASLYMRALLSEQEKIVIDPVYLKTHSNVYRNVIFLKTMAGGGVQRTLEMEPEPVKQQLRVIYKTPGVPPHPLAAHPKISESDKQLIIDNILSFSGTDEGARLLNSIHLRRPVRADFERDYQPLMKLNLERYVENTHINLNR